MKMVFIAIVQPHLEFGNVAWSLFWERDKKLIESVLRRATKVIPGLKDKEYEDTLKEMKIPSMTYRRVRRGMIEVYKYTHTHNIYKLANSILKMDNKSSTRGHIYKLEKQRCTTSLRPKFFTQRVVERWNKLPVQVVEAPSVNTLKNRLDSLMQEYVYRLEEPPTHIRPYQKISS